MLKTGTLIHWLSLAITGIALSNSNLLAQQLRVQRITLNEAKANASGATAVNLGQLSIDAAKYHRQAVQADYFPKIDATFANLHFNKFMGQTFQLFRRTAGIPLVGKDQTTVAVTLTQPVTPIFKVKQAVDIARADEVIARSKAAQAVAQVQAQVERAYFALLIAQRKQTLAEIRMETAERPLLVEVSKQLVTARTEAGELTKSLNALMGFDPETELELVAPDPVVQTISVHEATQQALANSPEIVEAEQNVAKARAARNLSKLDYVPEVAVVGGYVYQSAIPPLPLDFSYVGVMATLNLFDFGKREKTGKERKTQLEMAEAAVDLVKAKVAATVQKAFLDFERTRKIRDLTRQVAAAYSVTPVSYQEVALKAKADRAQAEEEMFEAELDYRLASAQLQQMIEGR
jgi:outer membrane protein TolC